MFARYDSACTGEQLTRFHAIETTIAFGTPAGAVILVALAILAACVRWEKAVEAEWKMRGEMSIFPGQKNFMRRITPGKRTMADSLWACLPLGRAAPS